MREAGGRGGERKESLSGSISPEAGKRQRSRQREMARRGNA